MYNNNKYFAAEDAEKAVSYLKKKADSWYQAAISNGYLNKVERSFNAYYGNYYGSGHDISFGGEQGELINIAINHYRNIARNILSMVTAARPSFQARSINADRQSQIQTKLAQGLLDYYMRQKKLERYLEKAVEMGIVLSAGYIKMEWDATKGKVVDFIDPVPVFLDGSSYDLMRDEDGEYVIDELSGQYYDVDGILREIYLDNEGNFLDPNGRVQERLPIYEGDVVFKNLSPYDVVFDTTKPSFDEHDWILCRTPVNKYDLAEKYGDTPDFKDKITKVETKSDITKYKMIGGSTYDDTCDTYVYEFFHLPSEALPNGRYIAYLNSEIILEDTIMPYDELPIYRITPSEYLGSSFGYTDMFDQLPIQDAINSLHSTALTNNATFGVQSITSPIGSSVTLSQLEGGMNHIQYNPIPTAPNGGKPEPLQLTKTAPETYSYMSQLVKDGETISGMNSVVRGNADSSNLRSGNALALIQSQAIQYVSPTQRSYIMLIEDVGTGLIKLLQKFAQTPRVASIAGINNLTEIKEFTGEDLSSITRVVVDVGNALSQTTAGRLEIANNLVQQGLITSPEKYMQVLNSGNLETLVESEIDELLQIRSENENLMTGQPVIASAYDKHSLHIREHRAVIADPAMRRDPAIIAALDAHMQEHIILLQQTDPNILAIIGEQPIVPPAPPMPPQPGMPGQPPMEGEPGLEGNQPLMSNAQDQSINVADQMQNLPQAAQPPKQVVTPGENFNNMALGRV